MEINHQMVILMSNLDMKQVKDFYDNQAESYDKEYDVPYYRLYHEITWHNIKRFLPKRKNSLILDAGGGTGYWAIKLAKLGYQVILTDISEIMLKVSEEKIKKENVQDKIETKIVDIREMDCFSSNSFDLVLAEGDPVSYCLNPKKAIIELKRVVKPNAHVIISVDNKYSMISSMMRRKWFDKIPSLIKTGIWNEPFTTQFFTPNELRTLVETCGLKVVRLIGKPILTRILSEQNIITNHYQQILEMELKYCDEPSLVGFGGHLEIVGLKQD